MSKHKHTKPSNIKSVSYIPKFEKCPHRWEQSDLPIRVGTIFDVTPLDAEGLDFIVGLGQTIAKPGFPIQIYLPWPDMTPLSKETADRLDYLAANYKIGVFCLGGHGRSGTALAYIMQKHGHVKFNTIGELIIYVRGVYCKSAVETQGQAESLARLLELPLGDLPELVDEDPVADAIKKMLGNNYKGYLRGGC